MKSINEIKELLAKHQDKILSDVNEYEWDNEIDKKTRDLIIVEDQIDKILEASDFLQNLDKIKQYFFINFIYGIKDQEAFEKFVGEKELNIQEILENNEVKAFFDKLDGYGFDEVIVEPVKLTIVDQILNQNQKVVLEKQSPMEANMGKNLTPEQMEEVVRLQEIVDKKNKEAGTNDTLKVLNK